MVLVLAAQSLPRRAFGRQAHMPSCPLGAVAGSWGDPARASPAIEDPRHIRARPLSPQMVRGGESAEGASSATSEGTSAHAPKETRGRRGHLRQTRMSPIAAASGLRYQRGARRNLGRAKVAPAGELGVQSSNVCARCEYLPDTRGADPDGGHLTQSQRCHHADLSKPPELDGRAIENRE